MTPTSSPSTPLGTASDNEKQQQEVKRTKTNSLNDNNLFSDRRKAT